jgi:hypothetical protein
MAKYKFHSNNGKKQKNGVLKTEIHPDTKRWIFIICLFALAGISLLGLFDLAGRAGQTIDSVLTLFLGWAKFIFPIV